MKGKVKLVKDILQCGLFLLLWFLLVWLTGNAVLFLAMKLGFSELQILVFLLLAFPVGKQLVKFYEKYGEYVSFI